MINEIKEKSVWEDFLLKCREKTFLQGWDWGEFWQKRGNKIWRLEVGGIMVLAVKVQAKRGTYLLVQHNVVISKEIVETLKEIAKQEGCAFIRMAPLVGRTEENKKLFRDLGFKNSPMHANAYEATWQLDITLPEDGLFNAMRKTTRYLIRQAQKNPDIVVEKSAQLRDLAIYQKLNKEVAKRQKFAPFSEEYIKNEFEVFSKDDAALWLFGKYKGEVVAGALIIFWSGKGFYHQAASISKYAKLSVPYLLQWEAIKEAKKRGCVLYDFWGYVDPKKQPRHPWAGPTLFKMGFGGKAKEYIKTQDLPLSGKYRLIRFFETLRKIKRGL